MLKYKIRTFNRELYLKIENPLQNFFLDSKCIFTSDLSFNLKFVLKSDTHTHTQRDTLEVFLPPLPLYLFPSWVKHFCFLSCQESFFIQMCEILICTLINFILFAMSL